MLKTGAEHLEQLRDGRAVYIGQELVGDVTTHPAFRNAAQSVAAIYDMKADPANRDITSFEEDGRRFSTYYLRPRTREDSLRRTNTHRRNIFIRVHYVHFPPALRHHGLPRSIRIYRGTISVHRPRSAAFAPRIRARSGRPAQASGVPDCD